VDLPSQLLAQPDALLLDLTATSREGAISALHAQLAKSPAVKDAPLRMSHYPTPARTRWRGW